MMTSRKPFLSTQDLLVTLLTQCRKEAGLTQVQLAQRLGVGQSMVSKVERGILRLDLVGLRSWLRGIGKPTLVDFVRSFDEQASAGDRALGSWRPK